MKKPKLSHLVEFLQNLRQQRPDRIRAELNATVGPVKHYIDTHQLQFGDLSTDVNAAYENLQAQCDALDSQLDRLELQILDMMAKFESAYMGNSYRVYENEMRRASSEYILENYRISLDYDAEQFVLGRIRPYSDWKRTGLILRPGKEKWIHELVGSTPLYLLDQTHDLMAPALNRFNSEYQRRLRPYIVREEESGKTSCDLPLGQIGYCLAYNFFNYKPLEVTQHYLEMLFHLFAPGGVLHLTFTDCERPGGAELVEKNYQCYATSGLIRGLAEKIGYEILLEHELDQAINWIELRRPGERISLRGGQALAKVVDKVAKLHYNQAQENHQ